MLLSSGEVKPADFAVGFQQASQVRRGAQSHFKASVDELLGNGVLSWLSDDLNQQSAGARQGGCHHRCRHCCCTLLSNAWSLLPVAEPRGEVPLAASGAEGHVKS